MRIAALEVAGRRVEAAGDRDAVAAAYAALPRATPPRVPWWTMAVALGVLAAAGGVAAYVATRPEPPSRTYVRPLPPPSADAYVAGGVPLTEPALGALFGEELTDLVVDAGRLRAGRAHDVPGRLAKLRAAAPIAARGPALAAAWAAMLDAFERATVIAQRPGGPTAREYDELREAVRELSEALVAAGLGYHLEGRYKHGAPFVQSYRVEEVVFVLANGARRRVLSLRRLDRLNSTWAVLGMHDEDAGDPTLHLDRIDIHVASTVLPVLATTSPYPLGDDEWMRWPEHKELASAIGDAVRAEYAAALGADAAVATRVAALLVERADIIDTWRDKLGRRRIYFIRTDELFVPDALIDELEGEVSYRQRYRVRAIDAELAELGAPRVHARIHDLLADSVRRHEAQHGFDYDRDAELRYPPALEELLGTPFTRAGDARPVVRSARAELSAYLSSVINDPVTPHASLWGLARHAFDRNSWSTGEGYAALVALEGLARHHGVTPEGPRYARGVNRDRLAVLAAALARRSGEELRAAARALWTELYGEPPTPIVDVPRPTRAPASSR